MHLDATTHADYMNRFLLKEQADYERFGVPDEYTRPCGAAFLMNVDEATYNKIAAAPEKFIWGEGSVPPRGNQGPDGWRSR